MSDMGYYWQGGHAIQLEKGGLAIEACRQLPNLLYQIPEDEPVMTWLQHHTRGRKLVTRLLKSPRMDTSSHMKKVTQLNPTVHPQSGQSHAAIQTPKGLPTATPSCPPAYKVLPQNQPSLSPSMEDVQHQPSSPLSLLSSPKVLQSSDTENDHLDNREFHPTDLDEWAEDHINQPSYGVNYENSDTSKRKEDEVARHDDSSQLQLTPTAQACCPSQLAAPPARGCPPQPHAQIHPLSHSFRVLSPLHHVYLLKHPGQILLSRTCQMMIQCCHSLPHLHPNQTQVQALQMVTDMTIVKLIIQEMKENCCHCLPSPSYLSTISLSKPKKQHTSAEDELSFKEDNGGVMPGTPKLTGQGHHAQYLKNAKGSQPVKSSTAGFFPPLWNKLFDLAKAWVGLYVALEEPIPQHEGATQGQCSEVLFEVLAHYEEKNLEVEASISFLSSLFLPFLIHVLFKSYYPQYKLDMVKLIFADTHTFHCKIKKAAI
ncbi:hypothetical protein EDC04DRAFT_2609133 [Pisolithus marmoratus]|nr:hypothetical protein EDC04DRAFT_2609133 [Pisolithus marmoratus]